MENRNQFLGSGGATRHSREIYQVGVPAFGQLAAWCPTRSSRRMSGDRFESDKEGLRSERRGERDIFRKIVKRVACDVRAQNLFDELQAITGLTNGNKGQQEDCFRCLRHSRETKPCYEPAKAKDDAKTTTHIHHS
jgi:hypothetical protein